MYIYPDLVPTRRSISGEGHSYSLADSEQGFLWKATVGGEARAMRKPSMLVLNRESAVSDLRRVIDSCQHGDRAIGKTPSLKSTSTSLVSACSGP